jgi:hypothetical protein
MSESSVKTNRPLDVYNAQLSNEPAEELAKLIVDSSHGAFELVGFVSGGAFCHDIDSRTN